MTDLLQMHALPPSLFDGNNFNTSPPIAACAVSHALAWRTQRQGRGLLVIEDDVNLVLNALERIEHLRLKAREIGTMLLMMAPGETFEEDTVTCTSDDLDCSADDDDGVRVLREKMTLYTQVQVHVILQPLLCCCVKCSTNSLLFTGLLLGRGCRAAAATATAGWCDVRHRLVAGADVAWRQS